MNACIATAIGSYLALLAFMYNFFRNLRLDIRQEFDKNETDHKEIRNEIRQGFEKIDQRFERNEAEIKEIRHSLIRIETALYTKESCMLNQERQIKKAE